MKNIISLFTLFSLMCTGISAQVLQMGQAVFTYAVGNQVAQVIDVRNNGLACPGVNWLMPDCPTSSAAITIPSNWTNIRMGAIFGIAIRNNGDIFFAASPILAASNSVSTAGIIFKAKGSNINMVSDLITNTATYSSTVGTDKIPNSATGFGDIAYDSWHDQLFATNLLDGKIYRITSLGTPTGQVASVFDPFGAYPGGISPVGAGEKCWGVGVNQDNDGTIRVYFAREVASPGKTEIWSVALDATGEFVPASAALEFYSPNSIKITDLAFAPGSRMIFAERGSDPHNSEVWECHGTHLAWVRESSKVEVGNYYTHENSAGGVDYGYLQPQGDTLTLGQCSKMIWASSNAIRYPTQDNDPLAPKIYGIVGVPADAYPPPYLSHAIMVDFNSTTSDVPKGYLGDVEVFRDICPPDDICRNVGASTEQINDPNAGKCCWSVGLTNEFEEDYFSAVQFCGLDGVQLSYSGVSTPWGVEEHTPTSVTISLGAGNSIPIDNYPNVVELCLNGNAPSPQRVVVKWLALGPDGISTVVCTDTLNMNCPSAGNPRCVRAISDSLVCKDGKYTYIFQIKNNAPFEVQSFVITPLDPNIVVSPALTNLSTPGIPTGATSGFFSVNLSGSGMIPGTPFCFYLTAHNIPIIPGGGFPQECCTDSVLVDCIPIPTCDPCDGVTLSAEQVDQSGQPNACCFSLSITNNYYPGYFTGVQIAALGDAQLSYVSGWSIAPPVLPSLVTLTPPGGTLGGGTYADIAEICLNGFSTPTQQFVVSLLGPDSTVICADTFVSQCPPPPPPTCAIATSDSIWCEGAQIKYTFWIKNSPLNTFNIESFNLVLADPTGIQTTQQYFVLGSPLAPGNQAGPFTIDLWGSAVLPGNQFCYILTAHDGVWGGDPKDYPSTCCTDSVNVRCLPIPDCANPNQDSCCCCTGADIQLPNGFSPNADGVNDTYQIIKSNQKPCGKLSLTVLNRWGNVVWESNDYQDQWNGTNQNGVSLPEGTYFVILKVLKTGLALTNFVDLRR